MNPPGLQKFLDNLQYVTDRNERIQVLIEESKRFQAPDKPKPYPESHRVPGCESEAFVWVEDHAPIYAVENPQGVSAMALAVILKDAMTGATKDEFAQLRDEIIYDIFGRELSMGKSMGLMGMVRMTRELGKRDA